MVQNPVDIPCNANTSRFKPEDAERKGITRRLLRLSVGIEDTEDLIADLEQAFNK